MCRWALSVLALCALHGCQRPARPVELTVQDITVSGEDEYDALFEVCLDTLRAQRFKLDRVDARAGIITTFPITSQQAFEFWRKDVHTAYDLMEATLLTIRRRVEIQLLREGAALPHQLVVSVYRERFSTPDRQYNTSAAAFRVYSRSLPSTAGRRIVPERDDAWLPAGRDGVLERQLIDEITKRALAGEWYPPEVQAPPLKPGA